MIEDVLTFRRNHSPTIRTLARQPCDNCRRSLNAASVGRVTAVYPARNPCLWPEPESSVQQQKRPCEAWPPGYGVKLIAALRDWPPVPIEATVIR